MHVKYDEMAGARWENADAARDARTVVVRVLPLIADQTKAAEDVLHEYHLWAEDANDGEFAIWSRDAFMGAFHRLQMAFNALNEALDGSS